MHDTLAVRRRQAAGDGGGNLGGPLPRQPLPLEPRAQRLARQQLGDGVRPRPRRPVRGLAQAAEVVNREDVRVFDLRERLRLALEAGQALGVAGDRLGQDLHGHVAIEAIVARKVHLAHAARADALDQPVMREDPGGHTQLRRLGTRLF